MSEIEGRRARAFEGADDGPGDQYTWRDVQAAIKAATQVKITDEVMDAIEAAAGCRIGYGRLAATLAVLGFEVIE